MVPVCCLQYWRLNCAPFDATKKIFFFASCLFSFPSCFSAHMPGKKKPAKKMVARKVSVPPADAGAVAKRAPRTSVGQDVVEGDVDLEEEEEEEDEVVAEGNRPAEIAKRTLGVWVVGGG